MCVVSVPAPLRRYAGGVETIEARGATVREVLLGLKGSYPALIERICEPGGDLRSLVNVYLNEVDIRHLDGVATTVGGEDEILLVPAIAGG